MTHIFTTITRGGCVCVASEEERFGDLHGAINRMGANWGCLTSTVASTLAARLKNSSLRGIVLAGESIGNDCLAAWSDRVFLSNFYGPCENSIFSTGKCGLTSSNSPNDIGRPIKSNAWIVDTDNHSLLMPVGSVGEPLPQGPLLARGYLANAEETRLSFIEAPDFCNAPVFLGADAIRPATWIDSTQQAPCILLGERMPRSGSTVSELSWLG